MLKRFVFESALGRLIYFHFEYTMQGLLPKSTKNKNQIFKDDEVGVGSSADYTSRNELGKYPKISVIIPFFNTAAFLEDTLRSVWESRFVDLEVILIDDNSSDNSLRIAESWKSKWPAVKILKLGENRGAYYARNLGLLHATGEYVAFLDSDDVQHPERLAKQVLALIERKAALSLCKSSRWDEGLSRQVGESSLSMISSVFSRELITEVGFFHCVRWGADREFIKRVERFFGPASVVIVPEDLISARLRPGSLTTLPESAFYSLPMKGEAISWMSVSPSKSRLKYRENYKLAHARVKQKRDLIIDFPVDSNSAVRPVNDLHSSTLIPANEFLLINACKTGCNMQMLDPTVLETSRANSRIEEITITRRETPALSPDKEEAGFTRKEIAAAIASLGSRHRYFAIRRCAHERNPIDFRMNLSRLLDLPLGSIVAISMQGGRFGEVSCELDSDMSPENAASHLANLSAELILICGSRSMTKR
jgi:glycosyltransferase involved in cell wall biosynthesis